MSGEFIMLREQMHFQPRVTCFSLLTWTMDKTNGRLIGVVLKMKKLYHREISWRLKEAIEIRRQSRNIRVLYKTRLRAKQMLDSSSRSSSFTTRLSKCSKITRVEHNRLMQIQTLAQEQIFMLIISPTSPNNSMTLVSTPFLTLTQSSKSSFG